MIRLTKQGVRDLGGNGARYVPTCSHTHGFCLMPVRTRRWSSLFGEYDTTERIRVCARCKQPLDG
jgi:hypothetical protein